MIQFLVTAVIVVVFLFLLVVILALMTWVITRLLRFLFPQKFAAVVKAQKSKKKTPTQIKGERVEDRCSDCDNFGRCPAAMQMPYPCTKFKKYFPPEEGTEL